MYYTKRHARSSPQFPPPLFKHTYPIIPVILWSRYGSLLPWVSLPALCRLPQCPESIQNVYPLQNVDFGKEPEVIQGQIWWKLWIRTQHHVFMNLPIHAISTGCSSDMKDINKRGHQGWFKKWPKWWDNCIQSKGGDSKALMAYILLWSLF